MKTARAAAKAKPPITPPAIAPVLGLLWAAGVGLLVAAGLLVDMELVEDGDAPVGMAVDSTAAVVSYIYQKCL